MTRRKRNLLCVFLVGLVVVLGAGTWVYLDLYGQPVRFNAALYAADSAAAKRPFGYEGYAAVLTKYVDNEGLVDYAGLKGNVGKLDDFLRALAAVDAKTYDAWDDGGKVAFWTNAYNALTLKVIVDHYPIQKDLLRGLAFPANSVRQIPGAWDKVQFLVRGKKVTLNHIEHEVLRKQFNEPRIHMALVCAAKSCPRLRNEPYTGANLDAQLADQTRTFLAHPKKFRIDREGATMHLSSIFKWFGGDFVKRHAPKEGYARHDEATRAVLHFAAKHLTGDEAAFVAGTEIKVEYLKYDWSLNEQTGAGKEKG